MFAIQVENSVENTIMEHEVSRVPCVDEYIHVNGATWRVDSVAHMLDVDPDNAPVAIVRVR